MHGNYSESEDVSKQRHYRAPIAINSTLVPPAAHSSCLPHSFASTRYRMYIGSLTPWNHFPSFSSLSEN